LIDKTLDSDSYPPKKPQAVDRRNAICKVLELDDRDHILLEEVANTFTTFDKTPGTILQYGCKSANLRSLRRRFGTYTNRRFKHHNSCVQRFTESFFLDTENLLNAILFLADLGERVT